MRQLRFVRDDSGQGFIEYVVLVSLVLFAATAAYALFHTVRTRFEHATSGWSPYPMSERASRGRSPAPCPVSQSERG